MKIRIVKRYVMLSWDITLSFWQYLKIWTSILGAAPKCKGSF